MRNFLVFLCLTSILQAVNLPVVVDPATPLTGTYAVEWATTGNFESWTTSQVNTATVSGGFLTGTTSGTSPQITRSNFSGPDLDLGFNDYLELRIRVPASHTGDIKISYGTTGTTGFNAARVLVIPDALVPTDGAFHTYRIDVGPEPYWRATLRDLRIEPSATSGQAFAIDYLRVGDLPGDVYQARITSECPAAGGTTPAAAAFGPGQTVSSLESKHFRFLWNNAVAATSAWNANMARGSLRNAEEAWQVYVKVMGYREPCYAIGTTSGTKYKVNLTTWHSGYWEGNDDYAGTSLARFNITTDGLQVDPPSWIIPHELMHVFQSHNDNGNYSGQWETHANYGRERWLQYYQVFYPNRSNIEGLGVRDGHFMMSSGRNYYLTWPFLYYIDDNPDGLPDLADGMVKRLWQEGQAGEFWAATLDRLTPTTSLKDLSGYYARRCATWNFSNKAAMTAELNTQDPTRNARHLFTDLIERADAPGWWRVPPEKAPAQGAYAMHELIPTGTGAGRVVTVNLQGLADAARGADWRASLIAISDTGVERYTPLWSNGSSSITLAANEDKLYLSVAATPDWYANGGFNEASERFRSHPSRSRFHYQIQVTGATPRERTNGATTGLTQHANGGGYKSVTVPASVYIGPNARVTGGSVSGNARIEDYAVVSGGTVNSSAVISGHAWVRGGTITGNARVRDWAIVDSGTISGNARVLEHATVEGNLQDIAVAKGSAWHQSGGTLSGNAIVDGDYMFNKSLTGGITFGHLPYVGIPDNFTTATPTGLYVAYDFASAHDSRVLDQYGITDGFTIGSPTWTATDWKRKGFLSFNGSSQSIVLDRSVADMRAFTFAAWVKPSGGAANQTVLWLGASATKRLCFTTNNGSGQAVFSIVNGGSEQTLASTALPTGVWSHVAIALDGAIGTLFINGAVAASGTVTITPDQLLAPNTTTGRQHNYLARSEGSLMPMFQGSLDDVQFFASALNATQLAAVTLPGNGDVIIADNFNSGSYGASSFNSTLATDQQGFLAPLSYTVGGHDADYKIQHGNGGQLLMASWFGGTSLDLYASLNQNFAEQANGLNKPLKVQFDLKITDSSNNSNWSTVAIGSSQNLFVNHNANKFSSLFRHNGGTQQFAAGGDISQPISWNATGSTISLILSDRTGNGSAFNGNGSMARMFVNGTLAGTWNLTQLTAADGYLSLESNGVFANYDNLSVSFVTTATYAVTYNGNGNTGGSVPTDPSNPYTENANVTVLGNTGGLTKTGYSFANWNTAANGSSTSYNQGNTFTINAPVTLYAQWNPGPNFIWSNGAGTSQWTTVDANWLGAAWVNSASSHAFFSSVGGSLSLASGLSAGNVNVGNTSANFPATSFSVGSLGASSLTVQGFGSNGGNYATNPSLSINSAINLNGDAAIGRANLAITGGTFSANRIISNAASADWGRLAISGGTVTAINGVDGSVNTSATFQLELNGGVLETSSIRVANRDLNAAGPDSNNDAHLIFNGGTLKAIGPDNANFITLYGDGSNGSNPAQASYVQAGGAIIDTNGRNIGIQAKLLAGSGTGGLIKNGAGTLTLSASNSYTGVTDIQAGILTATHSQALGAGGWNSATMTWIRNGATLALQGGVSLDEHLHLRGTGVGGLGALRNISGNNVLSLSQNGSGSGPGFCLDDHTTIGVDADLLTVTGFFEEGGAWSLKKVGSGTLKLTQPSSFSGGTSIESGVLVLDTSATIGSGNLSLQNGSTCEIRNPSGAIADTATVQLSGNATLILTTGVTESVATLYVNGVKQSPGLYSTGSLGGKISGGGSLNVLGGTISLSSPLARQVIQRSASGTASVSIVGTYTETPDRIEARAVVMNGVANNGTSTAWTTIVNAPTGGAFSGTLLELAAGGWYQIEVRSITGGAPSAHTAVVQRVGVGDVYLTAGQSNSANYGTPGTNTDDRVSAMNYANGTWTIATDPMPGATGDLGSVWTRLGTQLTTAYNVPVGFVCVGVGGTTMSYWVPPSTEGFLRLKTAAQAFPVNGFRAVLWHQGESDSVSSTSAANYQSLLSSTISQLRTAAGWSMPWYVAEASFHPSTSLTQEEPVVAGQRRVIQADPFVFAGPATDDFHLEGKLSDSVHFNSLGLADHAQQWAEVLTGAAPLSPKNGNLESNTALADGGIAVVNMSDVNSPAVIGWRSLNSSGEAVADGGNGYFNPDVSFYGAKAADTGATAGILPNMNGRHVAFLYAGSSGNCFLQTRRATLQAKTRYALNVALGVRGNGGSYGNARIELLADGISLASRDVTLADLQALNGGNAANTFTDVQLTCDTAASVTAGQALAIKITKINGTSGSNPTYLDFDNVRLTSSVIPDPTPSDYDTWKSSFGVTGSSTDDDDHDALNNFFEYAFGLNPRVPSANPLVMLSGSSGPQLSYTRRKTSLTGLSYSVWTSTNLTNWTVDTGADQSVTPAAGDVEAVKVILSPSSLANSKLFIQIRSQ